MKLLQKGNEKRRCESTAANKTSSRSHALLQINIRLSSHDKSVGEEVKTGRLFMVDLAGSERARKTQNVGMRLQEGASINKSLLALGNVINALAEGGAKFVNFRDSKLTRLLKDALTGNCKTVMVAHVSPAGEHREESRNTLIYADKAKKITTKTRQNKVDVSYHISQYQAIISELKEEIRRLKSKLENDDKLNQSFDGGGGGRGEDSEKVKALKKELIETFNEQMELRKKLMEIENSIVAMSVEFEKQNQVIQEYENEKKSKKQGRRTSEDISETEEDSDDDDESDEVLEAWEDLMYIHNEQDRYAEMKEAVNKELQEKKDRCQEIEESLPEHANSHDQRELLALLCKVHELEIQQAEMARNGILKEHDLYRRDLLLTRYERQRSLCDQIITKQRDLLAESKNTPSQELEELYALYQLESQFTTNLKQSSSLNDLNNLRSNSVLSLRPDKLPPISKKEPEKLFKPGRRPSFSDDKRPSTPLSISSPLGSPQTKPPGTSNISSSTFVLPPIKGATPGSSPWAQEIAGPTRTTNPVNARKKAKRIYPTKPSSVEEILVLDSPKLNKREKEKRNKQRKYEPRRRGSLPGLKIPPIGEPSRPSSEGTATSRRGRQLQGRNSKDDSNVMRRRGNSLSRIQDRRRGEPNSMKGRSR